MILLAEAYTLIGSDESLEIYEKLVQCRNDRPASQIDLYRKMAPLYATRQMYDVAVVCYRKVLNQESDNLLKVQLLTKIAGSLKKCGDKDGTIQAGREAYRLCFVELGEGNVMTAKCSVNLAQVFLHFQEVGEAKKVLQNYLDMVTLEMLQEPQHAKLEQTANNLLQQILQEEEEAKEAAEGEGEGEQEYYDEEGEAAEGEEGQDQA